jgi:hypothetical protein
VQSASEIATNENIQYNLLHGLAPISVENTSKTDRKKFSKRFLILKKGFVITL